ncbi:MAG: hypothetical protein ACI9OD_003953 [Limisphaerales bacterium]|jgi:hypothetical protein
MKITLGTGISSTHLRGQNVFNELACSPPVFLEILEQRLGLTAERPSQTQRIAAYRKALERRLQSGAAFYAESFGQDPFAVAETLLGWRDDLLMHGMEVDEIDLGCERIDCLRQVETYFDSKFKCSEGERIRQVTNQNTSSNAGVDELRVVDPEEWLPFMWKVLLARLVPDFAPPVFEPVGDSDLARFQKALLEDQPEFNFTGDGSIEFVTAYSEAVLAHAAAQRIASSGEPSTLVEGDNLQLVDEALKQLDEPTCGAATKSRARSIPQLLNLVMQLQWLPFDPQRLLDFLVHPECPVSRKLRNGLAAAVIEEPGMGGTAWNQAIEKTRIFFSERHADEPDLREKNLGRIDDDLRDWLSPPTLNPTGAESTVLAEVAERLGHWANQRAQTAEQAAPMFHHLRALAREFAGIIREQPAVTRAGGERLLWQLTGSGVSTADGPAELGHTPVLPISGFVKPVDTVVWWNFAEPAAPPTQPWTPAELAALDRRNIQPPSAESLARQSADRQMRPILAARNRLILCKAAQREGEEIPEHPLWTRLLAAVRHGETKPVPLNVDERLTHPSDDQALRLDELDGRSLPRLQRWLQLPEQIAIPQRERESFSSLKTLIYSPFEWVCKYTARLTLGTLANSRLAVDARLQGQLVHRLVEIMFPVSEPGFAWQESSEEQLDEWIDRHWPTLLRHEGAMLLLPGHQSDASGLRSMARRTLLSLIQMLRRHDARNIVSDHKPDPLEFGTGVLRGDVDLCYESGSGESVVVDLKFGGHNGREPEVRNNTALQLAVYGYLMSNGKLDPPPKSAFYILTRRAWITGDGQFFDVRPVDPGEFGTPSMKACWNDFLDIWKWRREQLDARRLEVTFTGTEATEDSRPPHDAWGPVENDGKYSDHMKLAGWKEEA